MFDHQEFVPFVAVDPPQAFVTLSMWNVTLDGQQWWDDWILFNIFDKHLYFPRYIGYTCITREFPMRAVIYLSKKWGEGILLKSVEVTVLGTQHSQPRF